MSLTFKTRKSNSMQKNRKLAEETLFHYASMDERTLLSSLSSTRAGLSHEEAASRLVQQGKNIITTGSGNTALRRLLEAVVNPFNLILILIAVITFITDVIIAPKADYLTVSIIVLLVTVSSGIAFIQGERSNTAAEKLSKMVSNTAHVLRGDELIEIPIEEIVTGDIVKLSAGDMLPADLRFLFTKDTFVAQSALTGESNPVEKFSDRALQPDTTLTDIKSIGFMGSNIVSGSSLALVLATGNDTYFGSMAESLAGSRAKNSFERGIESISRLLVRMMLVMVPIVFLVNGIAKGNWYDSLLFAITVAVGLTPEMLPVIITSTLARSAVTMSKHKVIVRTLSAIQALGEMDVLCTDKTGTLTEDKIVLEKYMNVQGADDHRVLRHAYLNSYFQTGLKNLIDLAIISRSESSGLAQTLEQYERIDEIPFDFSRRRMSVVLNDKSGKRQLITKGAVEEILAISSFIELDGKVLPMDDSLRQIAQETYEKHNAEGLRMIAVAQKNEVPGSGEFSVADENAMVLIGFVGFLDPPKESAKTAISALKDHGVRTVVLTGDSEGVALKVCGKVGVGTAQLLTGRDVDAMDDAALAQALKTCDLFAKLSPVQKERVVSAFQEAGHTVGYMGDGINDAPALRQADVGISVDSAVDIAKESADIILLEKDLMVLEEGVLQGRKTFGNIIKYIKMAASGNFGNMISVLFASLFLPFLPMLPVQLLTQNLLCDFSQMGMPFDHVDEEFLRAPCRWETKSVKSFMAVMGPISSVFDIACFGIMWFIIGASTAALSPIFQCGWFVFGTVSQVLVIHTIRTSKVPFVNSCASLPLMISTGLVTIATLLIGFTDIAVGFDMLKLPLQFIPWLILLLAGYFVCVQLIKRTYIGKYKKWM